jgi:hypothetical protein
VKQRHRMLARADHAHRLRLGVYHWRALTHSTPWPIWWACWAWATWLNLLANITAAAAERSHQAVRREIEAVDMRHRNSRRQAHRDNGGR